MKTKVLILFFLLVFPQLLFANQFSVKYDKSTGKILAWGPFFNIKTNPGEGLIYTDEEIGNIDDYVVSGGKIRPKTDAEKKTDSDAKDKAVSDLKTKFQNIGFDDEMLTFIGFKKQST